MKNLQKKVVKFHFKETKMNKKFLQFQKKLSQE